MAKTFFSVTVDQLSRTQFAVGISPIPVMKWHDVVNAREQLHDIVRRSAGEVNRRAFIEKGAMAAVKSWGDRGIIFPENYVDGDEFIYLTKNG